MTGKEIIKAVLAGKKPVRLPFVPCIDGYTQSGLPEPYYSINLFELQKLCGTDMFRGLCSFSQAYVDPVRHIQTKQPGGIIVDVYETPVGSLREVHRFTPESPYIPFPVEHIVKTVSDLKVLRFIIGHTDILPQYAEIEKIQEQYPGIMASCCIEDTPFMHLLTKDIGIQNFVYLYYENPEEIEHTMHVLLEKNKKQVEISARGPCEVFICYENTDTAGSSVDWIKQYELPQLNGFAKIVNNYKKTMLAHMCGSINLIVEDIAKCSFQGIIDVTPPPTGDLDMANAAKIMAEHGKIIAGGIECNMFCMGNDNEFKTSVQQILDSMPDKSTFMLGSGDAVPCGTTIEKLLLASGMTG